MPYYFNKVIFHGTIGWILAYNTTILKTINGGETWEQLNGFGGSSIYFLNEDIGFTIGLNIYKTTDGGNSWTVKYSPPYGSPLYGINFSDDVTGWAYGGSGKLLKTSNGGENWIQISTNINNAILCSFFLDNNTGFSAIWCYWIIGWYLFYYNPISCVCNQCGSGGNYISNFVNTSS